MQIEEEETKLPNLPDILVELSFVDTSMGTVLQMWLPDIIFTTSQEKSVLPKA